MTVGSIIGIGIIIILILLLLFIVNNNATNDEGFVTAQEQHDDFGLRYQRKYNKVGNALVATNNEKVLGQETGGLFGSIQDTMSSDGKPKQYVDNPYPLEGGRSGMFAIIDKCEAVKTTDCNIFDNSEFSKDCGICLGTPPDKMGINSQGNSIAGGLVLTQSDRNYAKSRQQGNFLPPYYPTVGSCPAGRMVSTKAECIRVQNDLDCSAGTRLNTPAGCSQCFSNGNYNVVDPSAEAGIIQGTGVIMVTGSGTLSWSEQNQPSNTGSIALSTTPQRITIGGGESSILTLVLSSPPVPRPYDPSKTYQVNDHIIFNNGIFRMQEGAGAPGYNPNRPGDKLWQARGSYSSYRVPPSAYLAGYITSDGSSFQLDLYRIIQVDTLTGRKPRISNQSKVNGFDTTNMVPGFKETGMNLKVFAPFSFVDPLSQEASQCPSSPFITKASSAEFLDTDPCYRRGSGPGKFNLECLQQIFLNNGCTEAGTAYPSTAAKGSVLMFNSNGQILNISDIADWIYQNALSTSTGLDPDGKQLSIPDWSKASKFCSGVAINSPCDANSGSGPLSSDCITFLWDNQGENKEIPPGATYDSASKAKSLFSRGPINRFCTRKGLKSPVNENGVINTANMEYWKKLGGTTAVGVNAVKEAMKLLHSNANNAATSEDSKVDYIKECYGIVPAARPTTASSLFVSDASLPPSEPLVTPVLALWFDALDPNGTGSETAPANDTVFTSWKDKSGNSNHATSTTGVKFKSASMGGKGAMVFTTANAANGYFFGNVSITGPTMTIFAVINYTNINNTNFASRIIGFARQTNGNDFDNSSSMGLLRQSGTSFGPYRSGNYLSNNVPNAPCLLEAWYDGTKQYSCLNGSTVISGNGSGNFAISVFGLGVNPNRNDVPSYLEGEIAEIKVYSTYLAQSQRSLIEGQLAKKWGIRGSLPSSHPYKTIDPPDNVPVATTPARTGAGWSL